MSLNNGKTLETHHFFAYGEEFSGARTSEEKLLFTGHERDKNGMGTVDDLDYMHARYYGPHLGRFLSTDPVLNVKRALRKPQNWNRYSYVAGNPLKFIDPTGMTLELTGDADQRRKALQDLRSTVPHELRSFIRTTTTKDGRTFATIQARSKVVLPFRCEIALPAGRYGLHLSTYESPQGNAGASQGAFDCNESVEFHNNQPGTDVEVVRGKDTRQTASSARFLDVKSINP